MKLAVANSSSVCDAWSNRGTVALGQLAWLQACLTMVRVASTNGVSRPSIQACIRRIRVRALSYKLWDLVTTALSRVIESG